MTQPAPHRDWAENQPIDPRLDWRQLPGLSREMATIAKVALALFAIGASGYGLSLRCYLLAQRVFGAARTASVFAFAPFIGAAGAWALGERMASGWLWLGGLLMLLGVWLHLSESHGHAHRHEALAHEHAHSHDDGHHDHVHPAGAAWGWHIHAHAHAPMTHAHPHTPDLHHRHGHAAVRRAAVAQLAIAIGAPGRQRAIADGGRLHWTAFAAAVDQHDGAAACAYLRWV